MKSRYLFPGFIRHYLPLAVAVFAVMLLVGGMTQAADIINIPNGNFESGTPGNPPDNWRSFAVAGAAGAGLVDTSNPFEGAQAVLLSRTNASGDAALDKDTPDFRIAVNGGEEVTFYFAAQKMSGDDSTQLNFRIAEFGADGAWLGDKVNQSVNPPEGEYEVFAIPHTISADTRFINVAFRIVGTGSYLIDNVTTNIFPTAVSPNPADGAENVDPIGLQLSWDAINTTQPLFDVYMGDDPNADLMTQIATGLTEKTLADVSVDYGATYYWRVDVREEGDPNVFTGAVWSFTTRAASPFFNAQPQNQLVDNGDKAVFSVEVASTTPVTYQWYSGDGTPLVDDIVKISGSITNELTVYNVESADEGLYYCVATNSGGSSTSATARLDIKRLLAHWPLDDNTDSVVSGSPGAARIVGDPQFVDGIDGKALSVSGDDLVEIADPNYFNSTYFAVTVSCWFKANQPPDLVDWDTLVSKWGEDGKGWQLRRWWGGPGGQNNNACFTTRGTSGPDDPRGSTNILDGEWHLVVGEFDSYNSVRKLYVDGVLDRSDVDEGTITPTTAPVAIGGRIDETGQPQGFIKGLIDDVRIYNYPLEPVAVALLYSDFTGASVCVSQPGFDFNGDCRVDIEDFNLFAAGWLQCNLVPDCLP